MRGTEKEIHEGEDGGVVLPDQGAPLKLTKETQRTSRVGAIQRAHQILPALGKFPSVMHGVGPDAWGPLLWGFLHRAAATYPNHDEVPETRRDAWMSRSDHVIEWVNLIPSLLPCGRCVVHFYQQLQQEPLTLRLMKQPFGFFKWTVRRHNVVNAFNKAPNVTYEEAWALTVTTRPHMYMVPPYGDLRHTLSLASEDSKNKYADESIAACAREKTRTGKNGGHGPFPPWAVLGMKYGIPLAAVVLCAFVFHHFQLFPSPFRAGVRRNSDGVLLPSPLSPHHPRKSTTAPLSPSSSPRSLLYTNSL